MQKFSRAHIQKHFNHAAVSYDEAAVLQKQVATHVDERLDLVLVKPKTILDVGAGTGILTSKLVQRYPGAKILGLDLSHNMLEKAQQNLARPGWKGLPSFLSNALGLTKQGAQLINADANHIPLADASVDLIVTNLMLQWCDDLDKVFQEFRRVLKPEGLLMLTTFGPDTLKELRQAWSKVDEQEHVNTFIDMHDIGDALIRNGFGQPVMDVEHFTLTYEKPIGVLKDLKAIGATNATETRQHGLMGKQRFTQMLEAYDQQRQNGLIPATYEVIHGHAWAAPEVVKGPGRNREGVVEISLDEFAKQTQSL
ncbi:MAG: malonyl-ACP O-methyltransferase BioC [Hydrogenovibrio crunogenus]|uniref:Malonyl-[acyl-carrier protein] O-methyltransferase n=1 Tax=Hydrogenovibrio crunogenus (strain DSM 25203 / XCL-2) TaxID=317025 RepID=Q31E52_HYDCU|nr:malonyl-ACP O-methyltransferase BioC [Hydrogenovibrio crunogenus]